MWTENSQMYKVGFKEAKEPVIKLSTFIGSGRKQRVPKKIYFCFIDYSKVFDFEDHNKLWKIH